MTKRRVLFAGTPEFARASLQALLDGGIEPVAVLTQPDRPAGRGKRLRTSPVKQLATEREITVLQPSTLRGAKTIAALTALDPELIIVVAYGLLLPQVVLDIPTHGCLNVHASLLPRWRGAAPIQAAILAGDRETGISLMSMTAGLDSGPVFATRPVEIADDMTAGQLHNRLAEVGAKLLLAKLDAILNGEMLPRPQDEALATYAGKIGKRDAELKWQHSAQQLQRKVRAYNPVPGAWFVCGDERVKCLRAAVLPKVSSPPGTVSNTEQNGIAIACAEGTLELQELQRPGKRPVTGREFATQIDLRGKILG